MGIVLLIQHLYQALYFGAFLCIIFIECADILKDIGHLVDRVVTALRSGAVAGNTLYVYTDFHTSSLAAVDSAVSRLCGDNEFRTNLVFVDNVLPAETVTVFFLNSTGYEYGVFVA